MTARPVVAPADQLALELPGLPPLRLVGPAPRWPRRPAAAVEPTPPAPGAGAGERVWLVWEDDEVLGAYADPSSAAADCAALRRHAQREHLDVRYDWMAVPVFGGRRHDPPAISVPRRR